jgi:hypothetical protein
MPKTVLMTYCYRLHEECEFRFRPFTGPMPNANKTSHVADESQSLPHHTHSPEPLRVGGVLHTWRLEEGPLLDGCLGPLVYRDVLSDPMQTGMVRCYEIIFSPADGENFPSSVDVSLELTTESHMVAKKNGLSS